MDVIFPRNKHVFPFPLPEVALEIAQVYGNNTFVIDYGPYPEQEDFHKVFRHSGPNDPKFERWCFEQWFLMKQWMKENNREIIFKAEFDCLILDDLENILPPNGFLY